MMKHWDKKARPALGTALMSAALLLAACGGSTPAPAPAPNPEPPPAPPPPVPSNPEGTPYGLEEVKIGGFLTSAVQYGKLKGGQSTPFEFYVASGSEAAQYRVTLWVGDDTGRELAPRVPGSYRVVGGDYQALVPMPDKIAPGLYLWAELSIPTGVVGEDKIREPGESTHRGMFKLMVD